MKNTPLKGMLVGNAAILLTMLSSTIYSIDLSHKLSSTVAQDTPLTKKLTAISTHQLEQAIQFESALHHGAALDQTNISSGNFHAAVKAFDKGTEHIVIEIKGAKTLVEAAIKDALKDQLKELELIANTIKSIQKEHEAFITHAHSLFMQLAKGDSKTATQMAETVKHEEEKLDRKLESLLGTLHI